MADGRKASSGRYSTALLKGDLFGGVTAAVVALPLALAFGVASGLGPVAGTVLALLAFPAVPVIGPIPHTLPVLQTPDLEFGHIPDMPRAAFTPALLGSIDSLLTSLIADSVTRSQHHREMLETFLERGAPVFVSGAGEAVARPPSPRRAGCRRP